MSDYIIDEIGEEVISERHQKDFKREEYSTANEEMSSASSESFTDLNFEDI
jgi:hypothetical protein